MRNVLTKAVGAQDDVEFDILSQALSDEDVVPHCSDGLTNMLSNARILAIVTER